MKLLCRFWDWFDNLFVDSETKRMNKLKDFYSGKLKIKK